MDEQKFQYRIRPLYGEWNDAEWQDFDPWSRAMMDFRAIRLPNGSYAEYGIAEVEVRIKPIFEPGYYEANTTTHDVRWFTSPPENPAWKRVEVTRVDG